MQVTPSNGDITVLFPRCRPSARPAVHVLHQSSILTCGEPPQFTAYDFLSGIAQRHSHPSFPEPEVAMIFRTSETDTAVDLFEIEMQLRVALQDASNTNKLVRGHPFLLSSSHTVRTSPDQSNCGTV